MQPQGRIFTVVEFDHPGNTDEIHPSAEIKTTDDWRARENQNRQALVLLDQGMSDGTATTQVTQPKRVVAVNQYSDAIHTISHTAPLNIPKSRSITLATLVIFSVTRDLADLMPYLLKDQ